MGSETVERKEDGYETKRRETTYERITGERTWVLESFNGPDGCFRYYGF